MNPVLLVPRRNDHGHRDRLWNHARAWWETTFPGWRVVEGHHDDGPFNRSAAVNRAAEAAGSWDVGIVIDSDVMVPRRQVLAAVATARRTGRVTWAHRRWRELTRSSTVDLLESGKLADPELDQFAEADYGVTRPISWSCCIVIPRAVWDSLGGFDERFVGWGYEDMAFQSVVCGLYGHERVEGDVVNLWHPRRRQPSTPDYVRNARLGRRYMVALRRDHQQHDRPDDPSPDWAQDIANLKRDDARLSRTARRLGMPNWDDWWPTLEELRDGAIAHRQAEPDVTLVVHSGGHDNQWTARREYLRQSLASLENQVTGPVVERLVFSDWSPRVNEQLREIVDGYQVVGRGHVGYTRSMRRLWTHLALRGRGSYVFLAEDDFTYNRPVDLSAMVAVLESDPRLAQLALLRDACYPAERERGGILGWSTDQFTPQRLNGYAWLEHRLFFTANPSLFRRSLTRVPWPVTRSSERVFGDHLIRRGQHFGFFGEGEEWVTHIGAVRAGSSY